MRAKFCRMKVTVGLPMAWGVSNVGLDNILKGPLNSLFKFFFNLRCPDGQGSPDCILVGFDAWVDAVYGQSLVPLFWLLHPDKDLVIPAILLTVSIRSSLTFWL